MAHPAPVAADLEQLSSFVRAEVVPRLSPGLALGVFGADGMRWERGFGVRAALDGGACTPRTPFRWFSLSKLVSATTVMRLVEQGRLGLDTPAVHLLPWFASADPRGRVTARHLLTHRSGLGNPPPFGWGQPIEGPGWDVTAEVARLVARHGRIAERNLGRVRYSNLGYLVVGELIAAASGAPFARCVAEEVLEPFGMDQARFDPDPLDPHASASPHEPVLHPRPWVFGLAAGAPRRFIDARVGHLLQVHPFRLLGGGFGGLLGSVRDAARFGGVFLGDGRRDGARLLCVDSVRALLEPGGDGTGVGWLHGRDASGTYAGHTGSGIGYRAELRLYPQHGLGVVVLVNAGHVQTGSIAGALARLGRQL